VRRIYWNSPKLIEIVQGAKYLNKRKSAGEHTFPNIVVFFDASE